MALLLFATAGQAEDSFFEPQSNEVRDSNLQRIHVKHKSGFDGRVRAIRFSLEPESVRLLDGTAGDDKVATADRPESSDRDVGTKTSGQDERKTVRFALLINMKTVVVVGFLLGSKLLLAILSLRGKICCFADCYSQDYNGT